MRTLRKLPADSLSIRRRPPTSRPIPDALPCTEAMSTRLRAYANMKKLRFEASDGRVAVHSISAGGRS